MTRYLVTDEQLRYAINSAIRALDIEPMGDNYIIDSTVKVSNKVLESLAVSRISELAASKIAETKPTESGKQRSCREADTSEYPVIRLEPLKAADLLDLICAAYQKGKDY